MRPVPSSAHCVRLNTKPTRIDKEQPHLNKQNTSSDMMGCGREMDTADERDGNWQAAVTLTTMVPTNPWQEVSVGFQWRVIVNEMDSLKYKRVGNWQTHRRFWEHWYPDKKFNSFSFDFIEIEMDSLYHLMVFNTYAPNMTDIIRK